MEPTQPEYSEYHKAFVGGLAPTTTEEQLAIHFAQYGRLAQVVILKERVSLASRCFGFVTFETLESFEAALASPLHEIDGKVVEVKKAFAKIPFAQTKNKIFVGGIPSHVGHEALRDYFAKFGAVVEHQIMRSKTNGKSRGFGFVTFETEESVTNVFSAGRLLLGGKVIDIKMAEPKVPVQSVAADAEKEEALAVPPVLDHFSYHPFMSGYWPPSQLVQHQYPMLPLNFDPPVLSPLAHFQNGYGIPMLVGENPAVLVKSRPQIPK